MDTKQLEKVFTVLVLKNENDLSMLAESDTSVYDYYSLADPKANVDSLNITANDHCILDVKALSITGITTKIIKVDVEKVIKDVKQRQIPRFKDNPPGQSTSGLIQDLKKYCSEAASIEVMNWLMDFKVQDLDLLSELQKMQTLEADIAAIPAVKGYEFKSEFVPLYNRKSIETEISKLEWQLGEGSLKNMEDYHNMTRVLRMLKYIDDNNTVQLKGRVACEMGSHELLVTELVFNNVLTDRPPAEIAALLSCLVFQQKNCSAPELTPSLEKGIESIKQCARVIGNAQKVDNISSPGFLDLDCCCYRIAE